MCDIVKMDLYGGPHDGETIEIHRDNLKIKPIINLEDKNGNISSYALDEAGKFIWMSNPDNPKFVRGWFVCDDDGNVISEAHSQRDALRKLDEFNSR